MAIEGRSDAANGRQDQARHGRRRRGRLHRRRAPHRRPARRPLRAGRRRAVGDARQGAPLRRGARPRARPRLCDFESMAKAEARAAGRHRGGRRSSRRTTSMRRAAYAFLDGRHSRHLRQAADGQPRRSQARCRRRWRQSGRVFALTHNYTGYPLVRRMREMVAAGELGEIRARAGRISAGLADRPDRDDRQQAGGLAHRSRALRRRRRARRHRHARLQPRRFRDRPRRRGTAAPT